MKFSDHVEVNINLASRHTRKQAALATWRFALASALARGKAGIWLGPLSPNLDKFYVTSDEWGEIPYLQELA
jgi:hypothetical protein